MNANESWSAFDAILLVSMFLQISGQERAEYNTKLLEAIERNTRPKEEERN